MRKRLFICLLMLGFVDLGFSQLKTHSFEEAEKLSAANPKPYFVFVKTDWCKVCKMMEKSTFRNPQIVSSLNRDFYFIVLDAETKAGITFAGRTFRFVPNGITSGTHELASELADVSGEISFPTLTILAPDFSIIGQKNGFIDAKSLLLLVQKFKKDSVFLE